MYNRRDMYVHIPVYTPVTSVECNSIRRVDAYDSNVQKDNLGLWINRVLACEQRNITEIVLFLLLLSCLLPESFLLSLPTAF